ncbi:CidA/LrgA family protein [Virgibacillus alimentarius]|uniref:CidA/LrgA family protein n=1 Tax=Virgibacillus alimentarius TaxID=698769 RepID=UPI000492F625|nr:CidA/LrgA family protein [Virgibacillus alimentarius]
MLNIGKIIFHIIILYCLYFIGNWVQDTLDLFIPGSVIGMILLFILLLTNILKVTWIEQGAQFLIKNLSLLFIPVTVGVIDYFSLFAGKGVRLIGIVLLSTVLVMIISGAVSQWIGNRKDLKHD